MGPPLAWAGYTFLRDAELEGYQGIALVIRSVACGLVYALLWGIYVFVGTEFWGPDAFTKGMEIWQMVVLVVAVLGIGALAAYVSFDLDPGSAFFTARCILPLRALLRLVAGIARPAGSRRHEHEPPQRSNSSRCD